MILFVKGLEEILIKVEPISDTFKELYLNNENMLKILLTQ